MTEPRPHALATFKQGKDHFGSWTEMACTCGWSTWSRSRNIAEADWRAHKALHQ